MRLLVRRAAEVLFVLETLGCAADEVTPPEPGIRDPGAFVAVDEGNGELTLYRSLDEFAFEDETLLFYRVYDVRPRTPEEARSIAKDGPLPIRYSVMAVASDLFPAGPYWVVWFRTLTEAEAELSK